MFTVEVPWPLKTRELVLFATAFDDVDTSGDIGIILTSNETEAGENIKIPPVGGDHVRIDFNGGLLFRKLPKDHLAALALEKRVARSETTMKNSHSGNLPQSIDEGDQQSDEKVLVTCSFRVDPRVRYIPQPLINFAVRTAIGTLWNMLLKVAEDVRDGKRPAHSDAIGKKRESLYDWAERRVNVMILLLSASASVAALLLTT